MLNMTPAQQRIADTGLVGLLGLFTELNNNIKIMAGIPAVNFLSNEIIKFRPQITVNELVQILDAGTNSVNCGDELSQTFDVMLSMYSRVTSVGVSEFMPYLIDKVLYEVLRDYSAWPVGKDRIIKKCQKTFHKLFNQANCDPAQGWNVTIQALNGTFKTLALSSKLDDLRYESYNRLAMTIILLVTMDSGLSRDQIMGLINRIDDSYEEHAKDFMRFMAVSLAVADILKVFCETISKVDPENLSTYPVYLTDFEIILPQ